MATAVAARIFKNFINGEWVESRSGKAYENRNPANTDELVGMFVSGTEEDANQAVDAAKEAYKKWRLGPLPKKGENIFLAGDLFFPPEKKFFKNIKRRIGKERPTKKGGIPEAMEMADYNVRTGGGAF